MDAAAPPPGTAANGATAFQPQAFGRYYLVDRVAMGGMAEIFRAKTFGAGGFENELVIKRILAHLSSNDAFVRMFMDEAKVSVLLQHANIVRIYDFGRIRENYFIAMEHVDGKDVKLVLRKLAERRKSLPIHFAAYIAMEAAKGLDHAHRKTTPQGQPLGIVHRDVSPSNILVGYQAEVKVADFGIVKAANCAGTTGAGTLKGKFEYMSPEQAAGKDLDRRSDIFALGIILWEMLTGRRLFKTDSDIKTLELIKSGDVDPPSTRNPQVPARLDGIVLRALARDPADRYQDARELHAELLEFLYPASPDHVQQSLSHFMAELFADEIAAERAQLETGTRIARAMHEAEPEELEPDWDEGAPNQGATGTAAPAAAPAPPSAGGRTALLAGGIVLALGAALWFGLRPEPEAQVVERVVEREVQVQATTGTLQLRVTPAAVATLDGTPVGNGPQTDILIEAVPPGTHILRLVADGHAPHEETLTVAAGERLRLPITLRAEGGRPAPRTEDKAPAEPTPTPVPVSEPQVQAASTATVVFTSKPDGADVFIEGRLAGRTPFEWEGPAGQRKSVEYRMSGYDTLKFGLTVPSAGGRETYERTMLERAKATGKISVNVSDGWADVYIDGKKIKATPLTHTLDAGTYEVRVRNDGAGLDEKRSVTVKAGETTAVSFSIE